MTIQSIKPSVVETPRRGVRRTFQRNTPTLVAAALVLALAGVFVARTAFARVARNTIDPVGIVAHNGRHVTLTGPIAITAGERALMRVTVTQRTTGAVAEGYAVFSGTGATNQWEIEAAVHGCERLEAGPAIAVALARSARHGRATDAHQWLVDITLVQE
ncbi:MAG TPA: hypothetical protein PLC99_10235 [Verrucomicrobiota bacterium]|nr:hypothetical protein [Verrucomicrobiota bacterium]